MIKRLINNLKTRFWNWVARRVAQHWPERRGFEAIYFKGKPIKTDPDIPSGKLYMFDSDKIEIVKIKKGYE